ncbi:MAG: hypothetical protein Q9162_001748 [Coniocarpon cinnabarinum]
MADPLSISASIVSVAGAGIKLSTTLYTYAETAFRADESLKSIAQEVSLTSAVINELASILKQDDGPQICSENAVQTARDTIVGCKEVFEEINAALQQSLKSATPSKPRISTIGRLVWPLKEQRMQLIRSNLDKLKSTLTLMLQVLQYARTLERDRSSREAAEQRIQIEVLAKVNQECNRNYESLVKALDKTSLEDAETSQHNADPHGNAQAHVAVSAHVNLLAFPQATNVKRGNSGPFDNIIGHLERAIEAIEDAKTDFGNEASGHLESLKVSHSASHAAKRALEEISNAGPPLKKLRHRENVKSESEALHGPALPFTPGPQTGTMWLVNASTDALRQKLVELERTIGSLQAQRHGVALADYNLQLMLLERQQVRRLLMSRQVQDATTTPGPQPRTTQPVEEPSDVLGQSPAEPEQKPKSQQQNQQEEFLADYDMQLKLLESQNKRRLLIARRERELGHSWPPAEMAPSPLQNSDQARGSKLPKEVTRKAVPMQRTGSCKLCEDRHVACDSSTPWLNIDQVLSHASQRIFPSSFQAAPGSTSYHRHINTALPLVSDQGDGGAPEGKQNASDSLVKNEAGYSSTVQESSSRSRSRRETLSPSVESDNKRERQLAAVTKDTSQRENASSIAHDDRMKETSVRHDRQGPPRDRHANNDDPNVHTPVSAHPPPARTRKECRDESAEYSTKPVNADGSVLSFGLREHESNVVDDLLRLWTNVKM